MACRGFAIYLGFDQGQWVQPGPGQTEFQSAWVRAAAWSSNFYGSSLDFMGYDSNLLELEYAGSYSYKTSIVILFNALQSN